MNVIYDWRTFPWRRTRHLVTVVLVKCWSCWRFSLPPAVSTFRSFKLRTSNHVSIVALQSLGSMIPEGGVHHICTGITFICDSDEPAKQIITQSWCFYDAKRHESALQRIYGYTEIMYKYNVILRWQNKCRVLKTDVLFIHPSTPTSSHPCF